MQLVIDIPDKEYEVILNSNYVAVCACPYLLSEAIKNGIQLPKGHGDLIDVSRKITVPTYDEQYEEWEEETLTILEALNRWSDEGVTTKDVIIEAERSNE